MNTHGSNIRRWGRVAALLAGALPFLTGHALAHCDGLDGPVVTAARQALEKNEVWRVLVWVRPEGEREIRDAFERTRSVRALGASARELADLYFFETLVRIHRAGEGAPYTGLKPAGRDLGPAIPAADRALETGREEPLVRLLRDVVEQGLRHRFAETRAARSYTPGDVDAGREYVERYVPFVHYVERLYEAATTDASHHAPEEASAPAHPE